MPDIAAYLTAQRARHRTELDEFLRIPSVSAKSEHREDMQRAATWLVDRMIEAGLQILLNIDHRGAVGADPLVGDGAGILIQIPDGLYRAWAAEEGVELPPAGEYAVAMCFLPQDALARAAALEQFEHFLKVEKQPLLGWRDVPVDPAGLGEAVLASMPVIRQAFIGRGPNVRDQDGHERKLLAVRKQFQNPLAEVAVKRGLPALTQVYMPSFSTRTVLISPLWAMNRYGCASFQEGKVLVEKRWWTIARALSQRSSRRSL